MIPPVREQGPSRGSDAGRDDLAAAVTALTAEVNALRAELARRHLLDLAAGILVAQLALSPSDATDHLSRLAGSAGLSLDDLAADVVNAAAGTVVAGHPDAIIAGAEHDYGGEATGAAAGDRADVPSGAAPDAQAEGSTAAPVEDGAGITKGADGPRTTDDARGPSPPRGIDGSATPQSAGGPGDAEDLREPDTTASGRTATARDVGGPGTTQAGRGPGPPNGVQGPGTAGAARGPAPAGEPATAKDADGPRAAPDGRGTRATSGGPGTEEHGRGPRRADDDRRPDSPQGTGRPRTAESVREDDDRRPDSPQGTGRPPTAESVREDVTVRETAVATASGSRGRDAVRRVRQAAAVAETQDRIAAVADSLLDGGLRPLGVQAVWLWRRTASGCLQLVGHAGVSPLEASHWRWLPPEAAGPLHRALAAGAPGWLPDGPPDGERLPGPDRNAARAVVPLRRTGLIAGLALAVWPGPAELDETVCRAVNGLLEPAARLLDLAGPDPDDPPVLGGLLDLLTHPAMVLRTEPDTSDVIVEHLNEAALCSTDLVPDPAGRPLAQVFPSVHAELVRLVADARAHAVPQRAVRLPAGHRPSVPAPLLDVRVLPLSADRALVLWHVSTDPGPAVVRVARRLENVATFEDDLTTGESRWSDQAYTIFGVARGGPPIPLRQLGERLHPQDAVRLEELLLALTGRQEGAHTVVRVIRDDGALRHVRIAAEPLLTCGVLTGITGIYQDVSAQHHTEVALNATFDQLTTVQAQAAIRRRLVLELQQAIVPEVPTFHKLPGLQVAARYRPAAEEYQVGGDWYDVMPLESGGVLMAVGDIAGHGIDAATGMVALRNALRGLAVTGHSPGRLMAWLNEVTLHSDGQPTATAVCALYDPDTRSLRWASAGHLPLLLLREGHAELLDPPRNILLGAVPGAEYQETVTRLLPGDTLVLYTDGFIESHHMGLDQSLALLRHEAERLGPGEIDEQADRLLGAVTGDTDDDTSLVVVRVL
ncbi:SpoIIE family protein phosphatase [Streptomyces himalayensis]|uniref:SpoIIE family protein phosphatase n=1 Tax=Streptomyces himalayensis TaxID=2820085 RepID=UPI00215DB72B|nr:SpoIIE family protein phosphatase [Streptomyces himalayensis]